MNADILSTLGDRIKAARQATGLTQRDFASAAGYDRNFWGRLERGLQNPTLTTLVRIAGLLDTTVAALVADVDKPIAQEVISGSSGSKQTVTAGAPKPCRRPGKQGSIAAKS